jgi:hypothetical protein
LRRRRTIPRAIGVAKRSAVLAKQAGQAALVPGLDDLAGGELLVGVHAHVQRRVVGVGEAALARVHLHRGDAQVEVGEIRPHALLDEQLEAVGEGGADEARLAGDLGGQLGEAVLGDRVAVDADQRARRADAVGDQARVTPAADRAVDGDVAGARVQRLDQLAREDGHVQGGHVKKDGQGSR